MKKKSKHKPTWMYFIRNIDNRQWAVYNFGVGWGYTMSRVSASTFVDEMSARDVIARHYGGDLVQVVQVDISKD